MSKRFSQGDIVYWCRQEGHNYSVAFGMVDEQFSDAVCIDILEHKENRLVNGIPMDEFQSETKYKKLPKGWTYNTQLFEITYLDIPDDRMKKYINSKVDNPQDIKDMYDEGLLVKASTKFHGIIDTEITSEGYRVVRKHPMWTKPVTTHTSIRPDRCYYTYQEALDEVVAHQEELKRQSSLTDEEWSIEQIDKALNRSMLPKDEAARCREWLLAMDKVDEIEVRLWCGLPQWKYEKNKKWNNIEL